MITDILIEVGLQAVLIVCAMGFFYWRESLNKSRLLEHKEELARGMVWDKEIEIESAWIMLRNAEAKLEKLKEDMVAKQKEIEEEKDKTPMDLEKLKTKQFELEKMGYTGKTHPDGKLKIATHSLYSKIENEIEAHMSKVKESVMAREYLKVQLRAIQKILAKRDKRDFESFQEEELAGEINFDKKDKS